MKKKEIRRTTKSVNSYVISVSLKDFQTIGDQTLFCVTFKIPVTFIKINKYLRKPSILAVPRLTRNILQAAHTNF